jgi:hypothetical protein
MTDLALDDGRPQRSLGVSVQGSGLLISKFSPAEPLTTA